MKRGTFFVAFILLLLFVLAPRFNLISHTNSQIVPLGCGGANTGGGSSGNSNCYFKDQSPPSDNVLTFASSPEVLDIALSAAKIGINTQNMPLGFKIHVSAANPSFASREGGTPPALTPRSIATTKHGCTLYTFNDRIQFSGSYPTTIDHTETDPTTGGLKCYYIGISSYLMINPIQGFTDCPEINPNQLVEQCAQTIQCTYHFDKTYTYGYIVIGDKEGCNPLVTPIQAYDSQQLIEQGLQASADLCRAVDNSGKSVCGNTKKEEGEECDDGNTANGDGCDSRCKKETCETLSFSLGNTCGSSGGCQGTCAYEQVSCNIPTSPPITGNTVNGGSTTCQPCGEATDKYTRANNEFSQIIADVYQEKGMTPGKGYSYYTRLENVKKLYNEISNIDNYKEIKLQIGRAELLQANIYSVISQRESAQFILQDSLDRLMRTGTGTTSQKEVDIQDNILRSQYYALAASNREQAASLNPDWLNEPAFRDALFYYSKAVTADPNNQELKAVYLAKQKGILDAISTRLESEMNQVLGHSYIDDLPSEHADFMGKAWSAIRLGYGNTGRMLYQATLEFGGLETIRENEVQVLLDQKFGVDMMRDFIKRGGNIKRFYLYVGTNNQNAQLNEIKIAFPKQEGMEDERYNNMIRDIRSKMLIALNNPDVILMINDGKRPESERDSLGYKISVNFLFLKNDGAYGPNPQMFHDAPVTAVIDQLNMVNFLSFTLPGAQCVKGGKSLAQMFSSRFIWSIPTLSKVGPVAGEVGALGLGLGGAGGLTYVGVPAPIADFIGGLVAYTPQGRIAQTAKLAVSPAKAAATREIIEKTVEKIPNNLKSILTSEFRATTEKADQITQKAMTNFETKTADQLVGEINAELHSTGMTKPKLQKVFENSFTQATGKSMLMDFVVDETFVRTSSLEELVSFASTEVRGSTRTIEGTEVLFPRGFSNTEAGVVHGIKPEMTSTNWVIVKGNGVVEGTGVMHALEKHLSEYASREQMLDLAESTLVNPLAATSSTRSGIINRQYFSKIDNEKFNMVIVEPAVNGKTQLITEYTAFSRRAINDPQGKSLLGSIKTSISTRDVPAYVNGPRKVAIVGDDPAGQKVFSVILDNQAGTIEIRAGRADITGMTQLTSNSQRDSFFDSMENVIPTLTGL